MSQTKLGNQIKDIDLTQLEVEAITGCIIGDGTLCKSGNGKYYRLRIEHAARYKAYVEWKHTFLHRLCISPIQYLPSNKSYKVGTVGHPKITELWKIWYASGTKQIVPEFRLTPLMAAIWFMDDGTRHRDTVNFSVHSFSPQSIKILTSQMHSLKIETTVNSDSKGSRIYVKKRSYPNFKTLVSPYVIPRMAYKLS
jgi:hypothetical protein